MSPILCELSSRVMCLRAAHLPLSARSAVGPPLLSPGTKRMSTSTILLTMSSLKSMARARYGASTRALSTVAATPASLSTRLARPAQRHESMSYVSIALNLMQMSSSHCHACYHPLPALLPPLLACLPASPPRNTCINGIGWFYIVEVAVVGFS